MNRRAHLLLMAAALLLAGCAGREAAGPPVDGHAFMVAELDRIYQEALADPLPYFYLNRRRSEVMRDQLAGAPAQDRFALQFAIANELLLAGDTDAAIRVLERLRSSAAWLLPETKPLYDLLAIAYLRLGEQQNCIDNHSAQACILPLVGSGIHARQDGSRQAAALYEQIIERFPDDLSSRWLLNVAYMTLGEYPEGVPVPWRIDGLGPPVASSLPRFENVAIDVGVDVNGLSGGVCAEDFDGDGHVDLLVTSYGLNDPVRLFLNDGRGGFVDRTGEAGLEGIVGGLNCVHADYDNDGHPDVLILRGAWLGDAGAHPNSLLRNDGNARFTDVTLESGLLAYHPTLAAAWADVNGNGLLDLFVGNESGSPWQGVYGGGAGSSENRHPSHLFMNNGDGTFTDMASELGLDIDAFVKGAAWGDVNDDGLPDLYVSILGEPNRLYVNRGGARFEEIAGAAGVQEPTMSFATWFWDYDQDGRMDLLVLPYDLRRMNETAADAALEALGRPTAGDRIRLYRNNGDETFSDVTREAGLDLTLYAMGAGFGDLDNSGFPDFYAGTGAPELGSLIPNRLFLNEGNRRFTDVTLDGGFGHLQKGHAVAFADFNRDGHQDVYAVIGGAVEGDVFQNALFANPGVAPENAWIQVRLEGRRANRSAVGARITAVVRDRDGGRRRVYHDVSSGGSFGASPLSAHLGLGGAEAIDTLTVAWPHASGPADTYTDLPVRTHFRIVEGAGAPELLTRPATAYRTRAPQEHVH
jgi:hypothetical protein